MQRCWQKPRMTIAGQRAFWDDKANVYDSADMTVDNEPEIQEAIKLSLEIPFKEIITFGGAVGCRDPTMILNARMQDETIAEKPQVIFNDLSQLMLRMAHDHALNSFAQRGFDITYIQGTIIDACKKLQRDKRRRLIMGVYDCESFFVSDKEAGYPLCGFDEYLKNSNVLGQEFLFDWLCYSQRDGLSPLNNRCLLHTHDNESKRNITKRVLRMTQQHATQCGIQNIIALQIIGRTLGRRGFFISHWYLRAQFKKMLEDIFRSDQFVINEICFAKGMVYCIEPRGTTITGVITLLNNVIGNTLPHQQLDSLRAIRNIM